ncbi:MAG: S8 family serine peptidase, partial [Gammaproteobacteria bacterium]|nr:S8 family serine peptidase [Gammaproteobacteria bacterium]
YDPAEVDDLNGHGTAMSAVLAARGDNHIGISGVAWTGQIMALRAFDENGNTTFTSGISDQVSQAIDFAVANGARIINLSFGTVTTTDPTVTNSPEYQALVRARDAGVLVVASACNEGLDNDANGGRCFPASFDLDNIIAVAASDAQDHIAAFSNYGRINVDLAAPGDHILASTTQWNTVKRCASANGVPLTSCGGINTGASSVCRAVMSVSSTASGLQGGVVRWAEDSLSPTVNWSDVRKVSFMPSSTTGTMDVYADLRSLAQHGSAYQLLVSWASQGVTTSSIEVQCRADGSSGIPAFFSGTSAAAAFVSGAAALLLADDPSQDYVSLRDRILQSVDALPIVGDAERVASGGRLNVAAALGLPSTPAVVRTATTVSSGGGGSIGLVLLAVGLLRMSRPRTGAEART